VYPIHVIERYGTSLDPNMLREVQGTMAHSSNEQEEPGYPFLLTNLPTSQLMPTDGKCPFE
jgi:hypothetical protein